MPKKHQFTDLASAVEQEIAQTAAAIAPQLPFAQPGAGAVKLTRDQALEHVRFNWANTPGFPQALLDRMAPLVPGGPNGGMRPEAGLKAYHKTVSDAFPEGSPQWHAQQAAMAQQPVGPALNGTGLGGQGMNLAPAPSAPNAVSEMDGGSGPGLAVTAQAPGPQALPQTGGP